MERVNKEKERQEILNDHKNFEAAKNQNKEDKFMQMKRLTEKLMSQMKEKVDEKSRLMLLDKEEYERIAKSTSNLGSDICSHSKKYKCRSCSKAYPRKLLTKHPSKL